jgi:hypothetical protein
MAANWPPRSNPAQCTMLVKSRSTNRRIGLNSDCGYTATPNGADTVG